MAAKDQKIQLIQDAALALFSRYGFRKTSMLDIAESAGISRAALYLYFKNKNEVFRSLSIRLHEDAMVRVEAELAGEGRVLQRVERALSVFMLDLTAPVTSSPHGQELFDANMALAADITQAAEARLLAWIEEALRSAVGSGEIDLAAVGGEPRELARMILNATFGFKHATPPVAPDLAAQLALFMRALDRAFGGTA